MATYYVRLDGNDSNTGLGSGTNQAWQTLSKALGATGIGSGDTLYIAPGDYRQTSTLTPAGTYNAATTIIGDVTASQFTGITAGRILITSRLSSDTGNSAGTFSLFTISSKNYLRFQNLTFEHTAGGSTSTFVITDSIELQWLKCLFINNATGGRPHFAVYDTTTNGLTKNYLIQQCVFQFPQGQNSFYLDTSIGKNGASSNYVYGLIFDRCVTNNAEAYVTINNNGSTYRGTGFYFYNCVNFSITATNLNTVVVSNCTGSVISFPGTSPNSSVNNCSFFTSSGNVPTTTTLFTGKYYPHNLGMEQLWGITPRDWFTQTGLYSYASGTSSGVSANDFYGNPWTGTTPDIGAYNNYSVSLAGQYNPTERNASTITIAPGSTSQSIELYLGATGLTASTSGLSARYNRTRTASVSIPLVARTIAQAWTPGGFAEVDATNMPGVYRLDLPDAALAAGADDVTVVVRGASGTNGAVMTVKLSSGGLTSAQTASAVWDASPAGYNTATTFGGVVNETNQLANSLDTQVQDVPSNVWEEMRATHTTAGTFGQYVNAELVTPVTSAALVRMGPYEVKADGLGASDPLDIQKGAQHGVDIQCVDGNGNGIDITSATVTAKVYNSGGSLVDTYACTATYAADGRANFTIDTTLTNTPGTYTATITRTTGASDTQVFGPLRIYVRDI